MFIISAGMPKSGSTLLSFYQKNILEKTVDNNGQQEFEQLIIDGKIDGIGHFVHNLDSPAMLGDLYQLSKKIGPFLVKTHSSLTSSMTDFFQGHDIIVTFIHRDPRDIILSAIDHGHRPMKNPAINSYFLKFSNVEKSIPLVRDFCHHGMKWLTCNKSEIFTYHQLITDPAGTMARFSNLLGVAPQPDLFRNIIETYTENQEKGKRQYNTGKLTRFKEEMNASDLVRCNEELSSEILFFGYSL